MKTFLASLALAATAVLSAPASAAVIGLQVEGGGAPRVYQLTNGDFLGLWGFDNREGANPGAGAVTIATFDDLVSGFRGGNRVVAFYNGTNPVNAGASEFDELVFGFTVADDARLFSSVWVRWTGGNLTYVQPNGRSTTTMSARATLPGDPLAALSPPVTEPPPPVTDVPPVTQPPVTVLPPDTSPPLSVVPLPAALPMLLVAFGALGLMARRRAPV